jgi:hypothetical protein
VWVSPRARSDALEPLRNSLVLKVISLDGELIDDLLSEPTMTNVYSGRFRAYYMASEVPHDVLPGGILDAQQRLHPGVSPGSEGFRLRVTGRGLE